MADSLYYTYIVDEPSSEAFFVPDGFEANVEVHLWGAGGGGGYASSGGGGGYVKSIVTVAEGDFFEIRRRSRHDFAPRDSASSESDFVHQRAGGEVLPDRVTRSVNQLHHARREAHLVDQLKQHGDRQRR